MGFWDNYAGPGEDEEKWRWDQVGKVLEGTVRRLQVVETQFGESPVAAIEAADGQTWALWISQVGLQRAMAAKAVAIGDEVRITFTGEVDTGKGNPAKTFDVLVRRPSSPAATAQATPPPEPAPAPAAAAPAGDGWG